jgi:gliding motility-associated-like protein
MKNFGHPYLLIQLFFGIVFFNCSAQNQAPVLTATGNQVYCPGTPINIATSFSIQPASGGPTTAEAVYVQISSGYVNGQDQLSMSAPVTNITSSWNSTAGKLTLSGVGGQDVPYSTLEAAVNNVVYNCNTGLPTGGTRTFSITIGEANYLPSTQHYYRYIPQLGISWTAAKTAAENTTYYGLQGYLATLLAADEAQLCGEQATGTGWIGGSDDQTEGTWKWVTGPEAGITFWQGGPNGSTPNFAFWNTNEPNNQGDENFAHITAPGVGILGSWNDLPNSGSTGDYVPKGYIVEYGGMPGDPILQISASTTITIPKITGTTGATGCGDSSVTLQAQSDSGNVYWYDAPTGGNLMHTGASFATPVITQTTSYYASPYDAGCTTATRTLVTATINQIPTLTVNQPDPICGEGTTQLTATPSAGTIRWYTSPTGTPFATGTTITSPYLTADTVFYAEAIVGGNCVSATKEQVTVYVGAVPVADDEITVSFCQGRPEELDATNPDGASYLWSTGATTPIITVTQGGTYTVEIFNAAGCSATTQYIANALLPAVIDEIQANNTSATIIMTEGTPADYQYSLDGKPYQDSNTFVNLSAGKHTVLVNSRAGCGTDSGTFVIYLIPKFFTPNGDNVNDEFTLAGISALPDAMVTIFDRYGKVITQFNRQNRGWDGTYNGNPLPANDYWYIIKIDDTTPEIKGHFSLLR